MSNHHDPRFPDRPQHPDFWAMSEVAIENDELWVNRFEERISQYVDIDSLRYMAWNRAGMATADPERRAAIAGAIMDGFVLGSGFMSRKQAIEVPYSVTAVAADGERRTKSS